MTKPQTAEEFGLSLTAMVGKLLNEPWEKQLVELGVHHKLAVLELGILHIATIDYCVSNVLGATSERAQILDAFYGSILAGGMPKDELGQRLLRYSAASKETHSNGPPWLMGCVFSELICGRPSNLALVMLGAQVFVDTSDKVAVLVRSRNAPSPPEVGPASLWAARCPHCGHEHITSQQVIGKRLVCSKCREKFMGTPEQCTVI